MALSAADQNRKSFQGMISIKPTSKPGSHYWHPARSPHSFILGRSPPYSARDHCSLVDSETKNSRASIAKLSAFLNLSPRNVQLVVDGQTRTDLIVKCMKLRVERDDATRVVAHLKLKLASCRLENGHSYQKWLSAPLVQKSGPVLMKGDEINDADTSDGPLCSKCLETWKHVSRVPAFFSSVIRICPIFWFDGAQSESDFLARATDVEVPHPKSHIHF
jgi:hypothetical protein